MPVEKIIHVDREIDLVDLIAREFSDEAESEIIDRIDQGQVMVNGQLGYYGWWVYRGDEVIVNGRLPPKQYSYAPKKTIDLNMVYTATINTNLGSMTARLLSSLSPVTVNNFVFLANDSFFDNTTFHHLSGDLYVRGGCPVGDGTGGPGYWIPDETPTGPPTKGTIAMAENGPDKSSSQFIIFLRRLYRPCNTTVFGSITDGFEVLDQIGNTRTDSGKPISELKILSVRIDSSLKQNPVTKLDQTSRLLNNQQSVRDNSSLKQDPVPEVDQDPRLSNIPKPTKTLIVNTDWIEITVESELFVEVTKRRYAPALLVKLKGETTPFKWYVGANSIKDPLEAVRKLNNNLFSGLHLRIRKENSDDSIKFASYQIESIDHPYSGQQADQNSLDLLTIETIIGPEFTTRVREIILTNKALFMVGDLRKFLAGTGQNRGQISNPGETSLNEIFTSRSHKTDAQTALDRFDDSSAKWFRNELSSNRVSWLLPESSRKSALESPLFFRQMISRMPGLPEQATRIIDEWTAHTSWFPHLSLELIQTLQKMRLADRNKLRAMLEQLSGKVSGANVRGPWEADFPELFKAVPIYVLYEFDATEASLNLLTRLYRNGCTCIGHMSVFNRESLDAIDDIDIDTWQNVYRRLNL